jgi:hypothetical protein
MIDRLQKSYKQQKESWASYVLVVEPDSIRQEQKDFEPIQIQKTRFPK